jgi:hypothetical protein
VLLDGDLNVPPRFTDRDSHVPRLTLKLNPMPTESSRCLRRVVLGIDLASRPCSNQGAACSDITFG